MFDSLLVNYGCAEYNPVLYIPISQWHLHCFKVYCLFGFCCERFSHIPSAEPHRSFICTNTYMFLDNDNTFSVYIHSTFKTDVEVCVTYKELRFSFVPHLYDLENIMKVYIANGNDKGYWYIISSLAFSWICWTG